MAEALLKRELAGQEGVTQEEITIESAGLGALVGHAASGHSVALMQDLGLDISGHRARQIHPDMVRDADLVLVMEAGHKRAIDEADRAARGKVYRLGEWQDTDIDDPYRQDRAAYEVALRDIQAGVAGWVEKIRGGQGT